MKHIVNFTSTVLFENGPTLLGISGNSMYPYYTNGQIVKIYPTLSNTLKPGKCYVYATSNGLIIHRLVYIFSTFALFSGDATNATERVDLDQIIGIPEDNNPNVLTHLLFLTNYFFLPFKKIHYIFRVRKYVIRYIIKGAKLYEKNLRKTNCVLRKVSN